MATVVLTTSFFLLSLSRPPSLPLSLSSFPPSLPLFLFSLPSLFPFLPSSPSPSLPFSLPSLSPLSLLPPPPFSLPFSLIILSSLPSHLHQSGFSNVTLTKWLRDDVLFQCVGTLNNKHVQHTTNKHV